MSANKTSSESPGLYTVKGFQQYPRRNKSPSEETVRKATEVNPSLYMQNGISWKSKNHVVIFL